MFYCFGENGSNNSGDGEGETLEKAICNWAGEIDLHLAAQEFNRWEPEVIEGVKVTVVFTTTVSKE